MLPGPIASFYAEAEVIQVRTTSCQREKAPESGGRILFPAYLVEIKALYSWPSSRDILQDGFRCLTPSVHSRDAEAAEDKGMVKVEGRYWNK